LHKTNNLINRSSAQKTKTKNEPGKIIQKDQQIDLELVDENLQNIHLHKL